MAQADVEFVRRLFDEFARTHTLIEDPAITDDSVWDMSNVGNWPEATEYRGPEAFRGFFDAWVGAFDDWDFSLDEVIDAEDVVFTVLHQSGRAAGSSARVEMTFAQLWSWRDGELQRVRVFTDVDAAKRAANLEVEAS